jgi:hypothetical protein
VVVKIVTVINGAAALEEFTTPVYSIEQVVIGGIMETVDLVELIEQIVFLDTLCTLEHKKENRCQQEY